MNFMVEEVAEPARAVARGFQVHPLASGSKFRAKLNS